MWPAKESDFTVTDCSSHVKRLLIERQYFPCPCFFPFFLGGARRDVGGEGKSCRPPQHPARARADLADCPYLLHCANVSVSKKKNWSAFQTRPHHRQRHPHRWPRCKRRSLIYGTKSGTGLVHQRCWVKDATTGRERWRLFQTGNS